MTTAPLRVLIADDHTVVRAGLRALLEGEPDLDVIAEAGSGEEAVRLAAQLTPDVALMDLRFAGPGAGIDGVEAARRLAAAAPGVAVVMLTSYAGRTDVVRALEAGARGYVLKAGPPEELFQAVRTVAAGSMGLAAEIIGELVGQVVNPEQDLSHREIEVVRLLAEGAATGPSPRCCTSAKPRSRPTSCASIASSRSTTGRRPCRRPCAGDWSNSPDT